MPIDLTQTMTFNWPMIVECAQQKAPDRPANVPQAGQPTDEFIRNHQLSQEWGVRWQQWLQCQTALKAWMEGWEAGHDGKPKDPAATPPPPR